MNGKSSWLKGFAAGLIIMGLISTGAVFAAGGMTAVTAYINSALHITYNGAAFKPAETDGSETPVFLYNNRTYLPLRAVAEKAGVFVDYDDATSEVILKSENELLSRANLALHYLKYKDYAQLSAIIHRQKGVTFSPYAFVDHKSLRLTHDQIFSIDKSFIYVWGEFDGSGDPIDLNVGDYIDRFAYRNDYIKAPKIGVNAIIQTGNTISNLNMAFPGASFVEYNFPGFDQQYEGFDWSGLRLVFEMDGGQWMLVGVVNDCWTI